MKQPKSLRRQRGVAAVEATIALPILFLMFYVTAEMGRMLYQYHQLNQLARNAARHLISYSSTNDTGVIDLSDDLQAQIRNMAVTGLTTGGTAQLNGLTVDNVQITVVNSDLARVTVSYDWTPIFGDSIPGFFGDAISLNWDLVASATMRPL
ncbi:pilus assembly protein [Marinobacter hydrocarbonoclasticus]|nr:pilus assembly protein [Marinobacter nauticus]